MSKRKHYYFAALVGLGLGFLLLATPTYAQRTIQRPIEDFLKTQGTCCNDMPSLWLPPDPNFCHWTPPQNTRFVRFAGVDYAGLAPEAYPHGGGPQFSGTVTERPLKDGRAEVTVLLHTKGANAWVVELDFNDPEHDTWYQIAQKPTLFGHRPSEVASGAPQALGDSFLKAVFINYAPGAPLPDLLLFLWGVYFEPLPSGLEIRSVLFQAEAEGPLTAQFGVPENTPGMLHILENANLDATAPGKALADLWPAEIVNLKVVGR